MCNLATWAVQEGRGEKSSTGRKLKTKGNGEKKKKSNVAFLPPVAAPANGLGNCWPRKECLACEKHPERAHCLEKGPPFSQPGIKASGW